MLGPWCMPGQVPWLRYSLVVRCCHDVLRWQCDGNTMSMIWTVKVRHDPMHCHGELPWWMPWKSQNKVDPIPGCFCCAMCRVCFAGGTETEHRFDASKLSIRQAPLLFLCFACSVQRAARVYFRLSFFQYDNFAISSRVVKTTSNPEV